MLKNKISISAKSLIAAAILSLSVSGCATLGSILPSGTLQVGAAVVCGAATAAVAPEPGTVAAAAAACGGAAIALVPDSTEIKDIETVTQATTYILSDLIGWLVGGGILLFVVAWLIPGPQYIFGRKIG